MFTVCVGLVFDGAYVQCRIICSLLCGKIDCLYINASWIYVFINV